METELPDFCSLGTADLLGLALDGVQQPEAAGALQDLSQLGAGGSTGPSQLLRKTKTKGEAHNVPMPGRTSGHAGPQDAAAAAAAAFMTTQELDLELCRLPLESEPQPGTEPPQPETGGPGPVSHIATPSTMFGGPNINLTASAPRILPDILDSAALDEELRALPLETQDQDAGVDPDADVCNGIDAVASGELVAAAAVAGAPALQSIGSASVGLGDGGMYMDSKALDDALRALPLGSSMEDNLPPSPPTRPTVMAADPEGGAGAATLASEHASAAPALARGGAAAAPPPPQPHSQPPPPAQQQQQRGNFGARSAASEWDAFDDAFGGAGSFDDDLEDYLAAQAAEAQPPAAAQPPLQQQPQPDLDDLDDLIAELEYGEHAPAARGPTGAKVVSIPAAPPQGALRGATSSAGADDGGLRRLGTRAVGVSGSCGTAAAGVLGRSHEAVQQRDRRGQSDRAAKRLRTEVRGRPTMEELFGSDDEDEGTAVAAAEAPFSGRPADAAEGRSSSGVGLGRREEMEGHAVRPSRPSYFPPQRMASSIRGGIALPVTAASGERVYCRMVETAIGEGAERGGLARTAVQHAGGAGAARRCGHGNLLGMPLADMLRELEDRQLRAAVAASEREEEQRRQQLQMQRHRQGHEQEERAFGGVGEDGAAAAAAASRYGRDGRRVSAAAAAAHEPSAAAAAGAGGMDRAEAKLWVDKYAPRHFTALLSDERINRQVALWVKDWDECVFGRTGTSAAAVGSKTGRKADPRPQQKVLLIGGPPGLGKTTLAHVVARHCGYHPYEINASDDRTAATLLTKIQDAVQMTAVLGGGRPNCVIVDEVDGATGGSETGGAVAALLKLIRAGEGGAAGGAGKGRGRAAAGGGGDDDDDDDGGGSDGENEGADGGRKVGAGGAKRRGGGSRNGAAQQRPLCRPIVCICNDLYMPALRPLRDVARVFHFSPPTSERLTARLAHICQAEGLQAEPAALRLLVERTDRDVRACLNTLQFLARRGPGTGACGDAGAAQRRTIEVKDVESLNIASKDTTQSAMDMWNLLLSTGAAALGRKRGGGGGGSAASQLSELCNRLQDFGDYDLMLNGLHENLPKVRFMDVNLNRTAEVEETMGLVDVLLRSCRRTGDFSSMRFVPPLLAKVRALAAQPERPRQLTWPRLGAAAARRASAAAQLVRSWASNRGTDPTVMASHGITVMALELVPALRILTSRPAIRAVAPNMMTPEEQAVLRRTAGLMLHYGLRYCFESPTPPGLQPLQLPEAMAPVSNNAIILGLTAEVQQSIAAAAAGGGTACGFQRQPQQPHRGRAPGGGYQGGRGGWGQYNSYGQGGGPGGDAGFRGPPAASGRSGGGLGGRGAPPHVALTADKGPPAAPTRHVPLLPAIDTLHLFTAFAGEAALGARVTVPHVVRQMISQQTEMAAIRQAEVARMAVPAAGSSSQPPAGTCRPDNKSAAHAVPGQGGGPLQPVAPPPPQRQMAGRMPPPAHGKKADTVGSGGAAKRKGTWMDAFKASVKARGGVGGLVSAGAAARQAVPAAGSTGGSPGVGGRTASPQSGMAAGGHGRLLFPVLYRFNEGYTNAVKRPLLMRELV